MGGKGGGKEGGGREGVGGRGAGGGREEDELGGDQVSII